MSPAYQNPQPTNNNLLPEDLGAFALLGAKAALHRDVLDLLREAARAAKAVEA